uniref:J domain-containing protein n=1 Tax=Strombidium rassoulzadegani TaxID=1082188 RepID=A0A7S3CSE1_9SPIT|mmetsp:Transcript_440/g.882  ORF Transcript_440/g.882 Transcript_440/m.882 type:complete len:352 (+) Transcript_440:2-1057(+)
MISNVARNLLRLSLRPQQTKAAPAFLRANALFPQQQARAFAAAPLSSVKLEKNYYDVLGVPSFATNEQIKDAYRRLAKKHHPDVRSQLNLDPEQASLHDPDVEKFREVVEAYQVLSVSESRANFDLQLKRNPFAFAAEQSAQESGVEEQERPLSPHSKPKRGSYAETRLAELKEEREKYNANDLGYYNGGVPRRNRGAVRGSAMMPPNFFHSPHVHNFVHYQHPDSARVTSEDSLKFKHFMGTDKADFQRTMPAHPMHYDSDFNYSKERKFWLRVLLGMFFVTYAQRKYNVEKDRARMTERLSGYQHYPAHHFHNRGGVIVLKDFVGFEKYYQNADALSAWYRKVYPNQMR